MERAVSTRAWPPSAFDAPVLRGLDARARAEIEDAGRLVDLAPGAIAYREGDPADGFFAVVSGEIALSALRRGDVAATELRTAGPGELFGEEATVGSARRATATAKARVVAVEVPVAIFRRAALRSGSAAMADKLERTLRRSATRDLLRTLAFTRDLPEGDVDLVLDAVRYHRPERGEIVYRKGDPATDLWLVGDGMVQLQVENEGRLHVRAYLSRGDFFGDAEITSMSPRGASAIASGPSLLLSIPAPMFQTLADRNPELLPELRRVTVDQRAAQEAAVAAAAIHSTQHVFRDLYRMEVARSLLVIDLDSCARCGHCSWACGELHGVARLVRRGDKLMTRVEGAAAEGAPKSLLVPSSCQHCENPSCMPVCPTGAIGRDPEGDVFIRDALCTGCGACAKACPWENIQMAERPLTAPRPAGGAFAELAVKCDLCREYESGPACVQACPTSSIFRIQPSEELADVREALGGAPRSPKARDEMPKPPVILGAAVASVAIGAVGVLMQARGLFLPSRGYGLAAGVMAGLGFVLLLLYAAPKRGVRLWMGRKGRERRAPGEPRAAAKVVSRVRPHADAHVAIGLVTIALVLAHAPSSAVFHASSGGALLAAFLASGVLGVAIAVAYRVVPARLTRLERTAALPEDFAGLRRDLLDRLYREVSGRSELVKKIFERILLPYVKSPAGGVLLLLSGRRLREEQAALRARIDRVLVGTSGAQGAEAPPVSVLGSPRLAGLDEFVRIVVELRALPAQRLLLQALRAGLPLHVVTFVIATALLVLHVVQAVRYP